MDTIEITYKDKTYVVYNPGELLLDDRGYLIDQLNKSLPKMGRYRSVYLEKTYSLTERDYYIIVVCYGDENNLGKCQYPGCNNLRKFNRLLPTSKIPVVASCCCEKHIRQFNGMNIVANQTIKFWQQQDYSLRRTPEAREASRQRALQQVKDGKHPWQKENSKDLRERLIKEGKNPIINMWRDRDELQKSNLDIYDPKKMKDIDYVLYSERESFAHRENPDDICYLYITDLDNDRFKIGATKNLENRAKRNRYHGLQYINPRILYTSTRIIIAEFEYLIKKKFIHKVVLGTETYSKKDYDEILEFINDQIEIFNNNITDSTTIDKTNDDIV